MRKGTPFGKPESRGSAHRVRPPYPGRPHLHAPLGQPRSMYQGGALHSVCAPHSLAGPHLHAPWAYLKAAQVGLQLSCQDLHMRTGERA